MRVSAVISLVDMYVGVGNGSMFVRVRDLFERFCCRFRLCCRGTLAAGEVVVSFVCFCVKPTKPMQIGRTNYIGSPFVLIVFDVQ